MFKNIIYLKNQNIYNLFETTNKNNVNKEQKFDYKYFSLWTGKKI